MIFQNTRALPTLVISAHMARNTKERVYHCHIGLIPLNVAHVQMTLVPVVGISSHKHLEKLHLLLPWRYVIFSEDNHCPDIGSFLRVVCAVTVEERMQGIALI